MIQAGIIKRNLRDIVLVFCLVFSFFVVSSIQSSIVAGGICICCILSNKKKTKDLFVLMGNKHCFLMIYFPIIIIMNSFLFSIIHFSLDISYSYSFITLFLKVICIFAAVEVMYDKNKPIEYYEKIIIYIFVIQSIIQLLAFMNRSFASILLHFNHAYELYEGTGGGRGLALSGGTGWPLGLSYGLPFIFYTKVYLLGQKRIGFSIVIMGVLLVAGIFFSGRSAYFGIIVSAIYFIFYNRKSIYGKFKVIITFIIFLLLGILLFLLFFSNIVTLLVEQIFPWAFEFFYKQAEHGNLETGSTNRLLEMWEAAKLITPEIFIFGEGYFTDPVTGKYFHRIDVGYLRNIFYWGIIGTAVVYCYQIFVFRQIFMSHNKEKKQFVFWILIYLFGLELKAMTVGFNHFGMTICILYALLNYKISQQANR
jgi:hypothetical protein